jgi:hypothetical protein
MPSRTKALEETIARTTRPDSDTDKVHAARTVPCVRVACLVLVNPAISPTAHVMYSKKGPFLSSG